MQTETLNDQALEDQAHQDQTLKAQILAELDHLSGETLAEILAYVQSLNPESASTASTPTEEAINRAAASTDEPDVVFADQEAVWQAYLETEAEREEVYCRLANS
ncbi:hypothetical protein GFS31_20280 [Leptolyngbya sp. BL0902]|uniref:hypothetical protein n=1 Tax=Leptolyngbya sp. BL0902 TaxID=1115757 RepID=UPI0018E852DB|nr:hypothetical protein [Leptolyngbya sp. BL0902]QQE65341.1 hypothetical protein GFS31_20280 [Leptolyngbya sp. BL0902]